MMRSWGKNEIQKAHLTNLYNVLLLMSMRDVLQKCVDVAENYVAVIAQVVGGATASRGGSCGRQHLKLLLLWGWLNGLRGH